MLFYVFLFICASDIFVMSVSLSFARLCMTREPVWKLKMLCFYDGKSESTVIADSMQQACFGRAAALSPLSLCSPKIAATESELLICI
jgi:hypothetical protein